jgi:hypothetical protein
MKLSKQDENFQNPGAAYHVILTDGIPDVILFDEKVRLSNILELFGGLQDHLMPAYKATLSRSMKAKYPLSI